MSAAALFDRLHAEGFELIVDDERLILRPASKLSEADRGAIRTHKVELLALVAAFEERAAIVEYDGGLSRAEAEAEARTCVVCEHLTRRRTCGNALEAGQGIVWPEPEQAATCDAYREKAMP